ncbi:MAG TPA: hypothetical protein VMG08_21420 [Allosphingosinicella sp.]|nr:hypothetical protein [Allosphingosinicella sp.]
MAAHFLFLAAAGLLQAPPPGAALLDVPADGMFDGMLAAGEGASAVPIRIRVGPDMPHRPFLTTSAAAAARLSAVPVPHEIRIGPVRLEGTPSSALIALGGKVFLRGVSWFDGPMAEGADLALGPRALPWEQVRFQLRPPRPGERRLRFPIVREGLIATVVRFRIGRQEVRLGFAPERPTSVATAAAGALLAATHDGRLGAAGAEPPIRLATGIFRPVRAMRLARPLSIQGLPLAGLVVRTRDFGGETRLPGMDPADAAAAPDEVVVTARADASPAVYYIMLGADVLAPCSTILFDNRRLRVELSCLLPEAP